MRYTVREGERAYDVEIEALGGQRYALSVDGGPAVHVDAHRTPRTGYSLLIEHRQYEGSVDVDEDDTLVVNVANDSYRLKVTDPRRDIFAALHPGAAAGRQELRAQMPGKIVKLLVRDGEAVSADQPLVVIEAMKMENELRAPVAGVVSQISVAEGAAVETDALLLVVEPPEADAPA